MNIVQLVEKYGRTTLDGDDVILIDDLIELTVTHAIVPREPSDNQLCAMERDNKYKDYRWAAKQYRRAIKAAEND